jgi:hypothetical protein
MYKVMAFFCHRDVESIFTCRSAFTPVPKAEPISLQDHIPESVKEERKKDGGVEYLPGERLLIKLGKQKKKAAPKLDVDRISKSLSRLLKDF